jgi:hypothetical protein
MIGVHLSIVLIKNLLNVKIVLMTVCFQRLPRVFPHGLDKSLLHGIPLLILRKTNLKAGIALSEFDDLGL